MLYPYSYNRGDGYGPDRLCDVVDCWLCVGHTCDCDVCADQLKAPDLKVLHDSQEHGNRHRSPNWEKEKMMDELKKMVALVNPGDYVSALGSDTRGHEVTRVGTLLAVPKKVKATRNGHQVEAIRVCVGEAGTDPATRQTWVTLFPGNGEIRAAQRPKAGEWMHSPIGDIPAVRADRVGVNFPCLFGGKGGKRSSMPTTSGTLATLSADRGRYRITSDDGETLWEGAIAAQIWWAYPPEKGEGQDQEDGHQVEAEVPEGQPVRHVVTGELVGYLTPDRFIPIR
ncbi:hypothetical protein [Streptomyces sp. 4F14]|uniref:hypothetical protein n=1 Tax=Streptomyces sp. 4F14 TaxID=3394380 RepID=UPI003A83FFB4